MFKSLEECLVEISWDRFGFSQEAKISCRHEAVGINHKWTIHFFSLSDLANNLSFAIGLSEYKYKLSDKNLEAGMIRQIMLDYASDWKNSTVDGMLKKINGWLHGI